MPGSSRDHGRDYQIRGTTTAQEQVVETSPVLPAELSDSESLHTGESAMQNHPEQSHHVHDTTTSNPDTLPSLSELDSMSTQPDLEDHTEPDIAAATKQKPALSVVPQYVRGEEHVSTYIQPIRSPGMPRVSQMGEEPKSDTTSQPEVISQSQKPTEPESQPKSVPKRAPSPPIFEPPMAEWDASRYVYPNTHTYP